MTKAKTSTNTFGKKLLELRKQHGWSQPELGRKIGTSATIISRYERGAMTPSIDVARKLADAFTVTVDHLVSESQLPDALMSREMVQRWEALDQINNEDKERILFVVDGLIRDARTRKAYAQSASA